MTYVIIVAVTIVMDTVIVKPKRIDELRRKIMMLAHSHGLELSVEDVHTTIDSMREIDKTATAEDVLNYLIEFLDAKQKDLDDSDDSQQSGYIPF